MHNKKSPIKINFNGKIAIFDNLTIATRAKILLENQENGLISDLERDVKIELFKGYCIEINNSKRYLPKLIYTFDFIYFDNMQEKFIIETVKTKNNFKEPLYRLKKRIILQKILTRDTIFREYIEGELKNYGFHKY